MNVAEKGSVLEIKNPSDGSISKQTVSYSIIDKYGQKVYVTNEQLAGIGSKNQTAIPSIIQTVNPTIPDASNQDILHYIGKDVTVVVYSDGNNIVWDTVKG